MTQAAATTATIGAMPMAARMPARRIGPARSG